MNGNARRSILTVAAVIPMLMLGFGQAAASPRVVTGPDLSRVDGSLYDTSTRADGYSCVIVGPGVGFGSNPAGGGFGHVTGAFTGYGAVTGLCMGGPTGMAVPSGFVG
ncbi:hypothetical protein [Rhodococcus sp. NPDC058514]|uniref:hypothetical protein n=1 Tax=unclassified Rhodococcus (in: high G+C Gram-positive bacteria) TaxID=192944 RepID=UPI0036526642